jgi:hypothetical protein
MTGNSMLIEVLHRCVTGCRLGPLVPAEATSKTNQAVSVEVQGDHHIAVRIRGFGEEGHRRTVVPTGGGDRVFVTTN